MFKPWSEKPDIVPSPYSAERHKGINQSIISAPIEHDHNGRTPIKSLRNLDKQLDSKTYSTPYCDLLGVQPERFTNIPLELIFVAPRVLNALHRFKVHDLGHLLLQSPEKVSKFRNLGAKSVDIIHEELEQIFIYLERPDIYSSATNFSNDNSLANKNKGINDEFISSHRLDIATGNLDFTNDESLPEETKQKLLAYREAYDILGSELAFACYSEPEHIAPLLQAFKILSAEQEQIEDRKNYLKRLLHTLPEERRQKKAIHFIRIFSGGNYEKEKLLDYCENQDTSLSVLLEKLDLSDQNIYRLAIAFYKWCNFDIAASVKQIATSVFNKERVIEVLRLRSEKRTLDMIGKSFNVTRERIRQIETSANRNLSFQFNRYNILPKICAERNGETIIPALSLTDYFGEYYQLIIYILKSRSKFESYSYDDYLDAFVFGNNDLQEKVQDALDLLPEFFPANSLQNHIARISQSSELPKTLIEKAITDTYSLTSGVYHRTRLTRTALYAEIVRKYYPDGIWVYDHSSLQDFRKHLLEDYGLDMSASSDHAIASVIMHSSIICDRGTYRAKKEEYLSSSLLERIHSYINNSPSSIILANAIFEEFEDELATFGVKNRYYLFGILHELFDDEYIFRKGYIYKDSDTSTIYTEIVRFVMKSRVPIKKEEIYREFPGITDIVITIALSDESIINFFGEYLYAEYLNITMPERMELRTILNHALRDRKTHHSKDLYEVIARSLPEMLNRNGINFGFSLYSVLEYLFKDEYQFSRPYIALRNVTIDKAVERLRDYILSSSELSITDISAFAREIHYNIYSMTDFIDSYNDTHFFASRDSIATINSLGIDARCAFSIESLILSEISDTELIANLECIHQFPSITTPWNEWIIYSTLKRWSTKLDVATSNPQLRFATPIVAPKGLLDITKYSDSEEYNNISVVQADNLDDIDSLIADYVLDGDL